MQARHYIDGLEDIGLVVSQLVDLAAELEELSAAGYVLERPVEADGLVLSRLDLSSQP